jgi:hypothetical protein
MNTRSQTRVNRYYTAEEVAEGPGVNINNADTIEVAGLSQHINGTCDTDEVDDKPPNYDPLDDDDKFDDTLKGDQDAADENMQ